MNELMILDERRLEAALLANSAVRECVVLVRHSGAAGNEYVAYVVPKGPFSPERLREHLQSVLPGIAPSAHFVSLFSIPRDAQGLVDVQALKAVEVIDSDLLSRWEERLAAVDGIDRVAVVARPNLDRPPPLHLSDLLAGWKPGIADGISELKAASGRRLPLVPLREYTPLAISDGGPLSIPADAPNTLTEALIQTAGRCQDRGITYIQADGGEVTQTYSQLLDEAKRILGGLHESGLRPHDRVILQIESLKDHFTTFWACVLGGITPVTVAVAPTYSEANGVVNKLFNTWKLLEQPKILASDHLVEPIGGLSKILPMSPLQILRASTLKSSTASVPIYESRPDDLVFFQLTSGSTGIPKCIQETHRGIISHIHGAQQFNGYSQDDIDLNWLPLDHVVPILTCHIKDVYLGCRQVQIKTELVLTKPLKWLDYLEAYKATHTWSPNFGFKLVSDALSKSPGKKWDLSRVKYFMNAGEQVTLPVVRNFLQVLEPCGVRPGAMQPAFGMAEVCTCMTYQSAFDLDSGVHRIAKSSLGGPLMKAEAENEGISFVGLGPPVPGVAIRITDSENRLVEEGVIGRLQIKGDVVTPGYLNNEAANREAFVGQGWFNSGDLGFMLNGRLTLTGREKEMIIIRGANFYCYEIEDVVNRVEGAEPTFTAACAVADPSTGTEGLAVFFVPKSASEGLSELITTIRARVTADMGIAPAFIIPLAKKDFPKTTSGKIQRSHLKKTLENGGFKALLKELDIRMETANTLPDWFFKRVWRRQEPGPASFDPAATRCCLLFADDLSLAARIGDGLRQQGHTCIHVDAAATFSRSSAHQYRIDPGNAGHYRQLLETLQKEKLLPDCILHCWSYTEFSGEPVDRQDFAATLDRGAYSVLFLAQALAHLSGPKHPAKLFMVSSHAQSVAAFDQIACERTPLLGLIKTIPHEMPWLDCCHVDLSGDDESADAVHVLREMAALRPDAEVAWRNGARFVPRLERANLDQGGKLPVPFKQGGMYLITGGLGGIGAEISRHLLETFNARLLLLGRTKLPGRDRWESHRNQDDELSRRIQTLLELEALPGQVSYEAVDICNADELRDAVGQAETRWNCKLDGVIHLAATFAEKLLVEETRESMAAALNPKMMGSLAIENVLADRPECLFVGFSSVNSLFGGATVGAYAAANSFMDGFVQQRRKTHAATYCMAWSPWDETGMSRGYKLKSVSRARGYYSLSPKQGVASFLAVVESGQQHVIIGLDAGNESIRQNLEASDVRGRNLTACYTSGASLSAARLETLVVKDRFNTPSGCRFEHHAALPLTPAGEIDRERLSTAAGRTKYGRSEPRTEPHTGMERKIAAIWKDLLGVAQLGIEENFFELGGHSLLAAQILFRLQDEFKMEFSLRDLFDAPTVAGFAARVEGRAQAEREFTAWPPVVPDSDNQFQPFKLTEIQQAYWVGRTAAYELGNVGCHIYTEVEFDALNLARFNSALQRLIQRHPMLRCVMLADGTQRVLEQVSPYEVRVIDVRGQGAARVAAHLDAMRESMSHQVLDAESAPLFDIRASLLDDRVRLHISLDLLVADARSFQILIDELSRFYENPECPMPELELTFRDYVHAANRIQGTEMYKRAREYWMKRLDTLPPAPDLPLVVNAESLLKPRFVRRQLRLEPESWRRLKDRAARSGVTPAGILLGAYAEILGVWSKRPRFTVNLTLFNRLPLHPQVNEVVGDFTSLTLLEVERGAQSTLEERCRRVQEQLWSDLNHRYFSGVQFLRELARVQSSMTAAAMPVVFTSILDLPESRDRIPALLARAKMIYGITQTPQVWLDNQVYEDGDTLVCNWDAVEALFPDGLLDDMFSAYRGMLQKLADSDAQWQAGFPEIVRQAIPVSQSRQRQEVNETDSAVTSQLLHTLFEAQVAAAPEQIAIVSGDRVLTYDELDKRANQIARQLRQAGAKPNTLIAVVCDKGWEQVVAALSVLKAGAAYLPIDPEVPHERLMYLLEHGEVKLALTTSRLAERLDWPGHVWRLCVDDLATADVSARALEPVQGPLDLAYVIYTSGSTGRPKGVVIDHRGAVNTILDMNSRFGVGRGDKVFGLSLLSFDLSVYDIFGIFAAGGTLVLPTVERMRDPMHWAEMVEKHGVTLWNSVPALMNVMLEQGAERHDLRSLRLVLLSGDWVPVALPDRVRHHAPDSHVISLGGATEASIWSILYPIGTVDPGWKSIPYGKPMLNQRFYVLNEKLAPCPVWVAGNLFIGGIGLAKGYWRDDEKTRASFITHPETGERLYRTGDLGRYLPDGNIEFLGREDFQVKVNGFRIELGEIETVLEKHPAVRTAVVIAAGGRENRRLMAYFVPRQERTPDAEELRVFLKQKLPDYMIPLTFLPMESLPLTANGKVDRRALPAPDAPKLALRGGYQAPRGPLEEVLAGIVTELLPIDRVGVFDNFFELGGNSLLVIQMISRIRDAFEVELSVTSLFDSPTVASLAERMLQDPQNRERIERTAEVLLSVAAIPESDVDAWLGQSART